MSAELAFSIPKQISTFYIGVKVGADAHLVAQTLAIVLVINFAISCCIMYS